MNKDQEKAHAEHLRQGQDHFPWRREHMETLAILKKAEAAIFAEEARIVSHDAEIARHEEQIAHGPAHSEAPPPAEHAAFARAHEDGSEHHGALLAAIRAVPVETGDLGRAVFAPVLCPRTLHDGGAASVIVNAALNGLLALPVRGRAGVT